MFEFKEIIFYETYKRLRGTLLSSINEIEMRHKLDLKRLMEVLISDPVHSSFLGKALETGSFLLQYQTLNSIKLVIRALETVSGDKLRQFRKYELLESPWRQGLHPLSDEILNKWKEVSPRTSLIWFPIVTQFG